jgi:ribosomal protein S18 acetylase RimI-like enzyme/DNA-binding transcriptional ArsR family regulator
MMATDSPYPERSDAGTDFISDLGELAFGTRLRRLSERLMRDISRVYADLDIDFEARWFPVICLLTRQLPLSVTDIAKALGLSHPAVNQIAGVMASHELVSSRRDPSDDRRRLLVLTPKGRRTATILSPVWETIAAETKTLIAESDADLLGILTRLETALNGRDMYERVSAGIKDLQLSHVEIVAYRPELKHFFRDLNEEWLRKDFTVEPVDEALFADPVAQIIEPGGAVLFARRDGKIVGTVALMRQDDTTYELAKMAVAPEARGQQVGRLLAEAAINWTRGRGGERLILETSPLLEPAIKLYTSLGFQRIAERGSKKTKYQRTTFTMSLDLKDAAA